MSTPALRCRSRLDRPEVATRHAHGAARFYRSVDPSSINQRLLPIRVPRVHGGDAGVLILPRSTRGCCSGAARARQRVRRVSIPPRSTRGCCREQRRHPRILGARVDPSSINQRLLRGTSRRSWAGRSRVDPSSINQRLLLVLHVGALAVNVNHPLRPLASTSPGTRR